MLVLTSSYSLNSSRSFWREISRISVWSSSSRVLARLLQAGADALWDAFVFITFQKWVLPVPWRSMCKTPKTPISQTKTASSQSIQLRLRSFPKTKSSFQVCMKPHFIINFDLELVPIWGSADGLVVNLCSLKENFQMIVGFSWSLPQAVEHSSDWRCTVSCWEVCRSSH